MCSPQLEEADTTATWENRNKKQHSQWRGMEHATSAWNTQSFKLDIRWCLTYDNRPRSTLSPPNGSAIKQKQQQSLPTETETHDLPVVNKKPTTIDILWYYLSHSIENLSETSIHHDCKHHNSLARLRKPLSTEATWPNTPHRRIEEPRFLKRVAKTKKNEKWKRKQSRHRPMSHQSHLHRRALQDNMNNTPAGVIHMKLGTELQLNLDFPSRHLHFPQEWTIQTRQRDETISITHTKARCTNAGHPLMSTQQTQNTKWVNQKKW